MHYARGFIAAFAFILAWSMIWGWILHEPIFPVWKRKEDRINKQQRLMRIGKVKYILIDGLLRSGLGFGFAMLIIDLALDGTAHDWRYRVVKLVFLSLFFGSLSGLVHWDNAFSQKGPPPFPPIE